MQLSQEQYHQYLQQGELETAESTILKAIELNNKQSNSYNILGLKNKEKGNLEEASYYINKAIEIEPNFTDAYINLGLILKSVYLD